MYIKINGKIYIHTVFLLLPLVFFSEGCIKYAAVFSVPFCMSLRIFVRRFYAESEASGFLLRLTGLNCA